jgi:hypothetical protein
MNPKKCFNGTLTLQGNCVSSFVVADVVEALCPFEIVKQKLIHGSMWCWPIKWLRDFVTQFLELESAGYLPKSGLYKKQSEFGISLTSLTLKVFFSFHFSC